MTTFTFSPDPGASRTIQPQLRTAAFGDGYQQRVGLGINTLPRNWSLTFTRPVAIIDGIDGFLAARAGIESFDWTPPTGSAGKWICKSWTRSVPHRDVGTLSATFEEVFGE
jgi:phage-related protein